MSRGELFRGSCLGDKSPGGNCPGGFSWGEIVRVVVVQGGIIQGQLFIRALDFAVNGRKTLLRLYYNG